jgi:hypothetical protein
MVKEIIEIQLSNAPYHAEVAYANAMRRAVEVAPGYVTLRFTDMESLDLFTQHLEYSAGYTYHMERDDCSNIGFTYNKDGVAVFSFAPGYHLDSEITLLK